MPTTVLPPLLCVPYLPLPSNTPHPCHPLLKENKASHGSQQRLIYQVVAGSGPSAPPQGMDSKKPIHVPGINSGPTSRGLTNRPSHITHIQGA